VSGGHLNKICRSRRICRSARIFRTMQITVNPFAVKIYNFCERAYPRIRHARAFMLAAISSTQKQTANPTNLTSSDRERRDTFSIFRCDVCESDRISLRVGIFMARILVRRLWKCLEKGRTKHRAALLRPHLRKPTFVFARGRYCNGNETCCASSSPHPPPLSS